jgi:hypothetical protein
MEKKKYQKISIFAKKNQWIVDSTSRSFPHSWLITGFVTRLTRWVSLVEQSLLTLTEHLSSHPLFSGVRINRSLDIYVWFVYRCLSFCIFSFGHCVVCSSSIYGFWLPLWYLQTLLSTVVLTIKTSASSACIVEHPLSNNFLLRMLITFLFIFQTC